MKYILWILTLTLLTTGCSTQKREADANLSDAELSELIDELFGGFDTNSFLASADGADVSVYHAGSTTGRPAKSILGLVDISIIDPDAGWLPNTWANDTGLNAIDVLFAEKTTSSGERFYSLAMKFSYSDLDGITLYQATSQNPSDVQFSDNKFQVVLQDIYNQTIVVRSSDMHPDYTQELNDSIKLNLYIVGRDGNEYYIGHISTMARYALR